MRKSELRRKTPLLANAPLERKAVLPADRFARSKLQGNAAGHRQPSKPKRRDTGPTRKVRALVAARSEGWCEYVSCTLVAAHIHHRRPRRMGGSSDPSINRASNLLHLCARCHDYFESHRHQAVQAGILLHATDDPTAVPVLSRHGRVWLSDDGRVLTCNPHHNAEEA